MLTFEPFYPRIKARYLTRSGLMPCRVSVVAGSTGFRGAIGLATSRSEVSIDLSTLSDHELELIASGEVDPSIWN